MPIPPNFSIVTLGVSDLARSIAFYESWGWEMRGSVDDGIVWFKSTGSWLGLFDDASLAADAGLDHPGPLPPYRGSTLALNLLSVEDVDAAFAEAEACGASVVKPATTMDWGGYAGYVADPDGHLWEICHNPFFVLTEGRINIP